MIKWIVIGTDESNQDWIIGHIYSLSDKTKYAAVDLAKQLCKTKGYAFSRIIKDDR